MTVENCHVLSCWVKGWALARNVSAPVCIYDGFRTDVGWPDQKARYVFAAPNDGYLKLAHRIREPYIHLKVCASPGVVRGLLPERWTLQPAGYMMTAASPMNFQDITVPDNYRLSMETEGVVTIARILTAGDETAAIGRIVFVEDHAIYDRVETHPDHRRKGLASAVMLALERVAFSKQITQSVLVATGAGRVLYEKLGWQLFSVYTSAVILPE